MPTRLINNKLANRLAVLLTLALAPLGTIAVYSEYTASKASDKVDDANLILRTIDSVTGQRALLESTMQAARALSSLVVERLADVDGCSAMLEEFVEETRLFSFAGFIETDGQMRCVSEGEGADFSGFDGFERAMAEPLPYFSFQPNGLVGGQPVILANWPVYQEDRNLGMLSISISRSMLELLSTSPDPETGPMSAMLVNHRGEILTETGSADIEAQMPPTDQMQHFIDQRNGVVRMQSANGDERLVTIAQLVPGQLFVLGSWDAAQFERDWRLNVARFGFPVLMWIASVGVVMLSVHYLVVRHLGQINTQMRRFALGNRGDIECLPDDAPSELHEIDSTFAKMAQLIWRDEQEREEALREKTVLLKEVHHRVKNNLQLIASILNMQIRRLQQPEARTILKGVQSRVRAIASIHRMLYEEAQVSNIDATTFLDRILQDTISLASQEAHALEIEQHFEAVSLPPEKIIPMALLFAEALTNALKYTQPPPGKTVARLVCGIRSKDGMVELWVRNSLSGAAPEAMKTGLGGELMIAFADQIEADLSIGPVVDETAPAWEMRLLLADGGQKPSAKTGGRTL